MKTGKRIGLILLAAGGSRRLGRPKQLLEYEGLPLLRRTTEAAIGSMCDPVVVVLGAESERCAEVLAGLRVEMVCNPQWADGMAGSIRMGLDALAAKVPDAEATVLCLCDQPHLSSSVLDSLVNTHLRTAKPIVASEYNGAPGAPALFASSHFSDLRSLSGDEGARRLFRRFPADLVTVPFPGGAHDVDTMDDYRRLTGDAIFV